MKAKKKVKKRAYPAFESLAVVGIVLIVAITALALSNYSGEGMAGGITGNVIAEEERQAETFTDVAVKEIDVNPPSPLIGEPFDITITVINTGKTDIETPFYITAEFIPNIQGAKPLMLNAIMTKILKAGESGSIVLSVATITEEGPMKIIATADSTDKIRDGNPGNNKMSKTIILTNQ